MQKRWRIWVWLFAVTFVLGGVFGIVYPQVRAEEDREIGAVLEVISLLNTRFYYQPVDTFALLDSYNRTGTINGMLRDALDDPYTRYMTPQAFDQMMTSTTGEYGGIGIVVGIQEDRLTVVSPFKGTPGDRAGLRAGDKILAIDGRPTTYMSLDEAVSLMRGPQGRDITLTIGRGEEQFDVYIVRDIINVVSVEEVTMLEQGIGYIKMVNFSNRTLEEMRTALNELKQKGMAALVLDLRFNPGGTLNAAIEVADLFVAQGPLLYIEDRDGVRFPYMATSRRALDPLPMVVLVNGSSASASEILAGALQDTGLATLVGTQTFGKGLVQSLHPLRDGSALTLTEQAYLTAGGRNINTFGITPDVEVILDTEVETSLYQGDEDAEDLQLRKAVELLIAGL